MKWKCKKKRVGGEGFKSHSKNFFEELGVRRKKGSMSQVLTDAQVDSGVARIKSIRHDVLR